MSIYDDQFNQDPKKRPQSSSGMPPNQFAAPPPETVEAKAVDGPEPEPPRRRGCGCGSCLLAMLLIGLTSVALCGIGGYMGYRNLPTWTHNAIVAAVNDSDLDEETKRDVTAQMDRLLKEYQAGNVSAKQFGEGIEELTESPILFLIMTYAAMENYIEPSGLSDEEKTHAKLVFQRVARGTFEKKIDPDDLDAAFDYISTKDFNGNRQIKGKVSDPDLREFIDECQRVADEAEVSDEPYEVDVAGEVKRIVDQILGVRPDDATDSGSEVPSELPSNVPVPSDVPSEAATETTT